jgi:dipeptidyl aminopeptidase/acylaminoacyl peptidase
MNKLAYVALVGSAFALAGCPKDKEEPLSSSEARLATDESSVATQASDLTTTSVELTTNFTIGGAVQNAAQELKTFVVSQLPCADVSLADATLTVKYGAKPGNCVYRGHTFHGTHTVRIDKNDAGDVQVHHAWTDFTNGVVKVNGTADVTWSKTDVSRRVKHDLTWVRILDNKTGHGTGDKTQRPLAGGIAEGIKVDGTHTWDGESGHWELAINGVEMRWADPVPRAGSYVLAAPKNKSLTLSFRGIDDNTIEVTVTSGNNSFKFTVKRAGGAVSDA